MCLPAIYSQHGGNWKICKIKMLNRKKINIRSCSVIVRVRVVLKKTVVGDSDLRFDNLSGSHHQSQVKVLFVSRMF